jgi:ribosomal protein L7/L12
MRIFYHLGYLYSRMSYEWQRGRTAGFTPGSTSVERQILDVLQSERRNFIAGIKRYRELTGAGLKDAKEAVEHIMDKHGIER